MKKTAILIICMMLGICSSAQDLDEQQEYDTVIYFPSTILECPMFFDSIAQRQFYANSTHKCNFRREGKGDKIKLEQEREISLPVRA